MPVVVGPRPPDPELEDLRAFRAAIVALWRQGGHITRREVRAALDAHKG